MYSTQDQTEYMSSGVSARDVRTRKSRLQPKNGLGRSRCGPFLSPPLMKIHGHTGMHEPPRAERRLPSFKALPASTYRPSQANGALMQGQSSPTQHLVIFSNATTNPGRATPGLNSKVHLTLLDSLVSDTTKLLRFDAVFFLIMLSIFFFFFAPWWIR